MELSILSEDLSHNAGKEMPAFELVSKAELKATSQIEKDTQVNKS